MNFKAICLVMALSFLPAMAYAEDASLEQQLIEVKAKLKEAEELNQQLKTGLVAKEQEIADLRKQVAELDSEIEKAKPGTGTN